MANQQKQKQKQECPISNEEFNTTKDLDEHLLVASASLVYDLYDRNPNTSRYLAKIASCYWYCFRTSFSSLLSPLKTVMITQAHPIFQPRYPHIKCYIFLIYDYSMNSNVYSGCNCCCTLWTWCTNKYKHDKPRE
jgi:hypothetical protein